MNLYNATKYGVTIGNEDASVGFCTVWNKVETATTAAPSLLEKCAIIGTLYSRQGVNPILRNLALNPHIQTLAIWGFGPLSQTPFGVSGTTILKALWENGVDENNMVVGTDFEIELEIDRDVVNTIIEHVDLLDLSEFPIREAVEQLPTERPAAYMEPREFDPPVAKPVSTLPAETAAFTIRGRTVLDTWRKMIFNIMRYGELKGTQYGMEMRESAAVQWTIEAEKHLLPADVPEDWPSDLLETIGCTDSAIKEYHKVFLEGEPKPGVAYTYGSRLRSWKSTSGDVINQVTLGLIENLKRSPDSRRAVATSLIPDIDARSTVDQPCFVYVQCLQRNGKLNMFATFRSHDAFKAAIPNAFGLLAMQKEVAEATGFERGSLTINSISAHIYDADFDHAEKMIDCHFLSRDPDKVFDANNADPRGMMTIRLENDEIVVEHQTPTGQLIAEYRGTSAVMIGRKIAQLELVSQIGHAIDIGHELQKAELALTYGLDYKQDQKLKIPVTLPTAEVTS